MIPVIELPLGRLSWIDKVKIFFARIAPEGDDVKVIVNGNPVRLPKMVAFREILDRHVGIITGICLGFSKSREEFEDLRQDSLVNLWRGLTSFNQDSNFSTWIYRVTLNTCISYSRKYSAKSDVPFEEIYREFYDISSEEELAMYRRMYQLIGMLKPIDRSIILMWLDKKSYDEIASVAGVSRDSIASRLKRIKDRLADMNRNIE